MKVLIIDTSIQIVRRLEELLLATVGGIAVYGSSSHETGRQLLKEQEPDILLLGINLPENESLQLLIEIKTLVHHTRVIVLSANTNPFFYEQCRVQGAHYFLDKYYEFEKIPDIIMNIAASIHRQAATATAGKNGQL